MLSALFGYRVRQAALSVGQLVAKTGVSPNTITVLGFLFNGVVAVMLARGSLVAGGLLTLVAGAFDMLDGAVARASSKVSVFGGFLDSTVDRYSEAVLFLGLLVYFLNAGNATAVVLIYAAIVGSLMISYARARAEAAGVKNEAGLLARPERVVLLGALLVLGYPVWALWILAIGTNLTAVQRIYHFYRTAGA
jgi:CDP-diacylglycerol--glycerol-3-phosphate 3-phosphatidyltransferase